MVITLFIHTSEPNAAQIELSIPVGDIEHHAGRYHTGWLMLLGNAVGDGHLLLEQGSAGNLSPDLRVYSGDVYHYHVGSQAMPFNLNHWSAMRNTSKAPPTSLYPPETDGEGISKSNPTNVVSEAGSAFDRYLEQWSDGSISDSENPGLKSSLRVSAEERDGCCVFTGAPPYHCSSCHIVPEKNAGHEYCNTVCYCASLSVGRPRTLPDKLVQSDVRNRIYMYCRLKTAWETRHVALLASDPRFVRSDFCQHKVASRWLPDQITSRSSQVRGLAEGDSWMLFFQDVGPSRAGIDDSRMDELRDWTGLSHNCHAMFPKNVPLAHSPVREGLHIMYGAQMIMRYATDRLSAFIRKPRRIPVAVKIPRPPAAINPDVATQEPSTVDRSSAAQQLQEDSTRSSVLAWLDRLETE